MASYDNDVGKSRVVKDTYPRPSLPADAPPPPAPARGKGRPGGTVEKLPTTRRRQR
jgi:hypothetical protein